MSGQLVGGQPAGDQPAGGQPADGYAGGASAPGGTAVSYLSTPPASAGSGQDRAGGSPVPAAAPEAQAMDFESTPATMTRLVTVRPGDCLWSIAQRYLGAGDRYPEIVRLNYGHDMSDGHVFTNPSLIEPGWQLFVPGDSLAGAGHADGAGGGADGSGARGGATASGSIRPASRQPSSRPSGQRPALPAPAPGCANGSQLGRRRRGCRRSGRIRCRSLRRCTGPGRISRGGRRREPGGLSNRRERSHFWQRTGGGSGLHLRSARRFRADQPDPAATPAAAGAPARAAHRAAR